MTVEPTRDAQANRRRKAAALALALWRRGLALADIAHLPDSDRSSELSVAGFARVAYREGGLVRPKATNLHIRDVPWNPPSSRLSPTWWLVAKELQRLTADRDDAARDLLDDAARWRDPARTPPERVPAAPVVTPDADAGALRFSRSLGKCGGCEAPVRWIQGPDRLVGLGQVPDATGRWVVDETALTGVPLIDGEPTDLPRWAAHSTVCPRTPRARADADPLAADRCAACWGPLDPAVTAPDRDGVRHTTHPSCDQAPPPLSGHVVLTDTRPRRNRR